VEFREKPGESEQGSKVDREGRSTCSGDHDWSSEGKKLLKDPQDKIERGGTLVAIP